LDNTLFLVPSEGIMLTIHPWHCAYTTMCGRER